MDRIAISIKQPWATLIVAGIKTIEIRRWSTRRKGRVYIHTGRVVDRRPEAWELVPAEFADLARHRGGLIGRGDLVGCESYPSLDEFARDADRHHNRMEWFRPVMYGFVFANMETVEYEPMKGKLFFFSVADPVRSADGASI